MTHSENARRNLATFRAQRRTTQTAEAARAKAIGEALYTVAADEFRATSTRLKRRMSGNVDPLVSEARAAMAYLLCHLHNWPYYTASTALGLHHTSLMAAEERAIADEPTQAAARRINGRMVTQGGPTWWDYKGSKAVVSEHFDRVNEVKRAHRQGAV